MYLYLSLHFCFSPSDAALHFQTQLNLCCCTPKAWLRKTGYCPRGADKPQPSPKLLSPVQPQQAQVLLEGEKTQLGKPCVGAVGCQMAAAIWGITWEEETFHQKKRFFPKLSSQRKGLCTSLCLPVTCSFFYLLTKSTSVSSKVVPGVHVRVQAGGSVRRGRSCSVPDMAGPSWLLSHAGGTSGSV